jgi:hypothetical protein
MSRPSVSLLWTHVGESFGEQQVSFVVRVANPNTSPASVALNVNALDASGIIIGSSRPTLPNIPARSSFDYFGELGSGTFSDLTGTPAKIEVSDTPDAFGQAGAIEAPLLKTSQVKLSPGNRDESFADAPYGYNLTVEVTNRTRHEITAGVTQQVILYDENGNIVGGETGSSDNVPGSLPVGATYREQWTGIPALQPAATARYSVWVG